MPWLRASPVAIAVILWLHRTHRANDLFMLFVAGLVTLVGLGSLGRISPGRPHHVGRPAPRGFEAVLDIVIETLGLVRQDTASVP